jgi:rare lipoprotein A
LSGKHAAAEQPHTFRRFLLAVTASVALAMCAGAVTAGLNPDDHRVADPTAAPGTTTPGATTPQPRTTERVSRQERSPSRSPSPSHAPSRSEPDASGTCGTSYYDDGQGNGGDGFTAAHRTLPFDTRLRVTNPDNGKSVVVRITRRGPDAADRCLDLSRAAFAHIAPLSAGVITAQYEVLN